MKYTKWNFKKDLEFMECDTCRAKAGSPQLCFGCLHNRHLISIMKEVYDLRNKDVRELLTNL